MNKDERCVLLDLIAEADHLEDHGYFDQAKNYRDVEEVSRAFLDSGLTVKEACDRLREGKR